MVLAAIRSGRPSGREIFAGAPFRFHRPSASRLPVDIRPSRRAENGPRRRERIERLPIPGEPDRMCGIREQSLSGAAESGNNYRYLGAFRWATVRATRDNENPAVGKVRSVKMTHHEYDTIRPPWQPGSWSRRGLAVKEANRCHAGSCRLTARHWPTDGRLGALNLR